MIFFNTQSTVIESAQMWESKNGGKSSLPRNSTSTDFHPK